MTIKEHVFSEIVRRTELRAKEVAAEPEQPSQLKSERSRELDEFFSTQRFCDHHDSARELVKILTGYLPTSCLIHVPPRFSIVYCRQNKRCHVLLEGTNGFPGLDRGRLYWSSVCERPATQEETAAFIVMLKGITPADFFEWVEKNLEKHRWMMEL